MSENLYCPGQKTYTEKGRENFDKIFRQHQSVEDKIEMRYCKLCGEKCGEMTQDDWESMWNRICDECVSNLDMYDLESIKGG